MAFFTTQDLTVALSNKYIAELNNANGNYNNMFVNVYANVVHPVQPLIHCTGTMLAACHSAIAFEFDPSGQFLFICKGNLGASQTEVVDATNKQLVVTGAVIPGGTTVLSSQDGKYAYEEASNVTGIEIYGFNRTTGTIRQGPSLAAQGLQPGGFVPATRR